MPLLPLSYGAFFDRRKRATTALILENPEALGKATGEHQEEAVIQLAPAGSLAAVVVHAQDVVEVVAAVAVAVAEDVRGEVAVDVVADK